MGFWAIICFIITAVAIDEGELFGIAFFGGLGILLTYLWATKTERARKQYQKKEELARAEKLQSAKLRFSNSTFIAQVIRDFRSQNWGDLDYNRGACEVYHDKIVTPHQTYTYISYGLGNLDATGCEQLALYLGEAYSGDYEVKAIEETHGYVGGYSSFVGHDGSTYIYRDGDARDIIVGYRLYSKSSVPVPSPAPVGRKW